SAAGETTDEGRTNRPLFVLHPSVALVAAAVAAAPAAAGAPAPAAARAAAPAPAALARPGLVDRQAAAAGLRAVERGDGGLRLLVVAHLHEAEALGAAGVPVHDHLGRLHGAVRREHLLQGAVGHLVA